MKITGIFACFLLLAAASVRADSFSFRDNYFKNSAIDLPALSLKSADHSREAKGNPWAFSAGNVGPKGFLSQIPSEQRPAKPAKLAKVGKAVGVLSFTPTIAPDPRVDYKMPVRTPKPGTNYRLKLIPDEPSGIVAR